MFPVLAQMTTLAPRSLALENRQRHAAVFERTSGIEALVLEPERKIAANGVHKVIDPDYGRVAFVKRNHGRGFGNRQPFPIGVNHTPPSLSFLWKNRFHFLAVTLPKVLHAQPEPARP